MTSNPDEQVADLVDTVIRRTRARLLDEMRGIVTAWERGAEQTMDSATASDEWHEAKTAAVIYGDLLKLLDQLEAERP